MSESVVIDNWSVDCQLCPFENKLSRPHQTVNQFLTKVMNFRQPIGKNTASLKNLTHTESTESTEIDLNVNLNLDFNLTQISQKSQI